MKSRTLQQKWEIEKVLQTKKTKERKMIEAKVSPSSPAISNSGGTGQNIRDFRDSVTSR